MSRNQTWDDRDTGTLAYQGFWFLQGTYNATRTGETGTLASSNDPNANVTFVFPIPAVAFYYYGMQRSRGGQYGICIDCDPNNRNFLGIDALNPTDDGQNPPVLLFSTRFERPGIHEVILRNQRDPRFPNENSQITLDRFELEIVDPNAATTTTTISSSSTTTTQNSPSTTTSTSPGQASSPSNPTSVGAIVGGVVGGCVVLLVIFGVWFICRRNRRRRQRELEQPGEDPEPFRLPMMPTMSQTSPSNGAEGTSLSSTLATGNIPATKYANERGRQDQLQSQHHHHVMQPSLTSTEWTQVTGSASGSGAGSGSGSGSGRGSSSNRRETDAGPVPRALSGVDEDEDDQETLPPDYDQVFQERERRSVQPLAAPQLKR